MVKQQRTFTYLILLFLLAGCRTVAPLQPALLPPPTNSPAKPVVPVDLPLLPVFHEANTNGIGEPLPGGEGDPFAGAVFSLQADLPAGFETALVEEHAFRQMDAATARALAEQFGFNGPLYVQQNPPEFAPPAGEESPVVYTAFEGARLVNISGTGLTIENRGVVVDYNQRPVFAEVAPLVEAQLQAWGVLDFAYELRELPTGDLALYRLIDGFPVEHNAFNVFFNHKGEIAYFDYQPLREVSVLGVYPLRSAEAAWEQLQTPAGRAEMRYQLWPRPVEQDENEEPFVNPRSWSPNSEPGQEIHLYITPAVYEAIDGSGLRIVHGDFTLTGDSETLAEIATHLADVLHVWGLTGRSNGAKTLAVTGWEVLPAVQYETFEGAIRYEGDQALVQTLDGETFLLAAAPLDIPANIQVYVNSAGRRDTGLDYPVLDWVSINEQVIWPEAQIEAPVEETATEAGAEEPATIQAVTINNTALIYFTLYQDGAYPHNSPTILLLPVWKFTGETDQNQQVTFWLPAVSAEFFTRE